MIVVDTSAIMAVLLEEETSPRNGVSFLLSLSK